MVGVLAMLLTLPVPTLVSKLLMATQEKKMKCVSSVPSRYGSSIFIVIETE